MIRRDELCGYHLDLAGKESTSELSRDMPSMSQAPLARKLGIKPGFKVLVHQPPEVFINSLSPLPDGAALALEGQGPSDVVICFVRNRADVEQDGPRMLSAARPRAIVWFAYPKKSSKLKTDIHRDAGWDALTTAGWEGVAMVAIDETWSALRFRPSQDVGT